MLDEQRYSALQAQVAELSVQSARTEERLSRHRAELDAVKAHSTESGLKLEGLFNRLSSELGELRHTISRGQWIILGAMGFFFLQQFGLIEFIKKVM